MFLYERNDGSSSLSGDASFQRSSTDVYLRNMRTLVKWYPRVSPDQYHEVRLSDGAIISEHRYVMEVALGRVLTTDEHVHHKDGNKHNNDIGNLELLTASEHAKHHGSDKQAAVVVLQCDNCGVHFTRTLRVVKTRQAAGITKQYCGKSCSISHTARLRRNNSSIPHGTSVGYTYHKCRCELCKKNHADRHRAYRQAKSSERKM